MKRLFVLILLSIVSIGALHAQLTVGADLKSRYVWRGIDFGKSPAFQPAITYKVGILSAGVWGSYSYPNNSLYEEIDYWLSVDFPTSVGTVSLLGTDYTFPTNGIRIGNFDTDGKGAHTAELGAQYTGPENFPLAFRGYMNMYNDPDNSVYLESSYPFSVDNIAFSVLVGASANSSAAYGTTGFSIINISFSATKIIEITNTFSLPTSVTFVLNPQREETSLVLGITL